MSIGKLLRWAGASLLVSALVPAAAPALTLPSRPARAHAVAQPSAPGAAIEVGVNFSGQLRISFHGSVDAGCAAVGVCDYSGTVSYRPGTSVFLIAPTRHGGFRILSGSVVTGSFFGGGGGSILPLTTAVVQRGGTPGGACADAQSPPAGVSSSISHGELSVGLLPAGASLLATRCAGPLDGDVARAVPRARIPVASVRRGHAKISLTGSSAFSGHGFRGTVDSTVTATLGKARRLGSGGPARPQRVQKFRELLEPLTVIRASGSERTQFDGSANHDVCAELDSCGITGVLSWNPAPGRVLGYLEVFGPATLSRQFLLGVLRGRRAAGPQVTGIGLASWNSGGIVRSQSTQAGSTCSDTASLGGGQLFLTVGPRRVTVAYGPTGPLRTRCPGSVLGYQFGAFSSASLGSGAFAPRLLGRPQFTVTLRPPPTASDDGYSLRLGGSFSLTLRRGRVRQQLLTVPTG